MSLIHEALKKAENQDAVEAKPEPKLGDGLASMGLRTEEVADANSKRTYVLGAVLGLVVLIVGLYVVIFRLRIKLQYLVLLMLLLLRKLLTGQYYNS